MRIKNKEVHNLDEKDKTYSINNENTNAKHEGKFILL